MSKINLDFAALNLSGDNYLRWALDTKIILKSKRLGECIIEDNNANEKDWYMAILIISHHLIKSLKDQYLTIENPLDLWTELKIEIWSPKNGVITKGPIWLEESQNPGL